MFDQMPEALRRKAASNPPTSYESVRRTLSALFITGPAYDLSSIHQNIHPPINWKNATCPKRHTQHKTAQEYLKCCTEDFTVLNTVKSIVLTKDPNMWNKVSTRIHNHIENNDTPPNCRQLHFELLLVNIFNRRTVVYLKDLEIVFRAVYNRDLKSLVNYTEYIKNMNSKNIFFKDRKNQSVVVVPTSDPKYLILGDKATFDSVNMSGGEQEKIFEKNREKFIFDSKNLESIVKIANMNIPRSLIKKRINPTQIFDMCNDDEGLDETYFFIAEGLCRKD